ncbi:hypothetical protein MCOR31_011162 [Pyricularia oryzae]|nr:hypothetical protein MCOR31_011162 [Pyricularia oryzae]
MFGTLSYDAKAKEPRFVESEELAATLQRYKRDKAPHVACEYCRTRKLKCSGQSSGCERCTALAFKCVYPPVAEGRRSKRSGGGAEATASESPAKRPAVNLAMRSEYLDQPRHSTPATELKSRITDHGSGRQDDNIANTFAAYPQRTNGSWEDSFGAGSADCFRMRDLSDETILDWELENILLSPSTMFSAEAGTLSIPRLQSSCNGDAATLTATLDNSLSTSVLNAKGSCSGASVVSIYTAEGYKSNLVATPSSISSSTTKTSTSFLSTTRESETNSTLSAAEPNLQAENQQQKQPRDNNTSEPAEMEAEQPCTCLRKTACLLERLSSSVADSVDTQEIDVLLSCSRQALRGCEALTCCKTCSTRSENVTLLAMAAQYLSVLLSKMAGACEESGGVLAQIPPSGHRDTENKHDDRQGGERVPKGSQCDGQQDEQVGGRRGTAEMRCGSYKIDTASEMRQVVTCPVMVQLMDLCQLLSVLKALSGTKAAALGTLSQAEENVALVRERLFTRGTALWDNGVNARGKVLSLPKP